MLQNNEGPEDLPPGLRSIARYMGVLGIPFSLGKGGPTVWIIDKILDLLDWGDHSSSYKMPREEFEAGLRAFQDSRSAKDDEPVETLYVQYDDGAPLPAQGILKDMGYRVGKNGLLLHERREILRRTFRVYLDSNSDWYVQQWGPRCSQARFNKMDRVLGGLAANAEKIRKNDMSEAIRNWREDQAWLRQTYTQWMHHGH